MIDLKARDRIFQERRQRSFLEQLISKTSGKKADNSDLIGPIQDVEGASKGNFKISSYLLVSIQRLTNIIVEALRQSPSEKDIHDIRDELKEMKKYLKTIAEKK